MIAVRRSLWVAVVALLVCSCIGGRLPDADNTPRRLSPLTSAAIPGVPTPGSVGGGDEEAELAVVPEGKSLASGTASVRVASTDASAGLSATSSTDLCFPLDRASYLAKNNDFGNGRPVSGSNRNKRCHAGNDLHTKRPGLVQAVADGVVTGVIAAFLNCNSGFAGPGMAGSLLVYHPSIDKTINYGEIDSDWIIPKKDDPIKKGQYLGRAGYCGGYTDKSAGMLHFEMYEGRVSDNEKWWASRACVGFKCATGPAQRDNWCTKNAGALAMKPKKLIDPRPFIDSLMGKYCTSPTPAPTGPARRRP